jgi:hypothetical protein
MLFAGFSVMMHLAQSNLSSSERAGWLADAAPETNASEVMQGLRRYFAHTIFWRRPTCRSTQPSTAAPTERTLYRHEHGKISAGSKRTSDETTLSI